MADKPNPIGNIAAEMRSEGSMNTLDILRGLNRAALGKKSSFDSLIKPDSELATLRLKTDPEFATLRRVDSKKEITETDKVINTGLDQLGTSRLTQTAQQTYASKYGPLSGEVKERSEQRIRLLQDIIEVIREEQKVFRDLADETSPAETAKKDDVVKKIKHLGKQCDTQDRNLESLLSKLRALETEMKPSVASVAPAQPVTPTTTQKLV